MLFTVDLIAGLAGMIIPPVFDFVKKKFIKQENDTPERTAGSLALTKPEILPAYTEALAKLYEAQTKWFNRDIAGVPNQWIINLRAIIRPAVVIISVCILGTSMVWNWNLESGIRLSCELYIGSWMTSRNI